MSGLRWSTAGESHGYGIFALVEGVPAGVEVDTAAIDRALARRQGGYGRSKRMLLEEDRVEVLTGLKRGRTLGTPITLLVRNRDRRIDGYRRITRPRPGHADLAGALKYGDPDCANVMERASARETAARVAAGALAAQVLGQFGIEVRAWVTRIGTEELSGEPAAGFSELRAASPFYSLDPAGDARAASLIDGLRTAGDTVGGQFLVEARGVPAGLGSHAQWDRRLDGRLAGALMSIPAIKAVEIGAGVEAAWIPGLAFHDPIAPGPEGGFLRPTNRAGGIEGGISNGEALRCRVTMKPIPSVRRPLASVDLESGRPEPAVYERSDVCAVPAASLVGEAVVSLVVLDALLEKTGGDSVAEVARNLDGFLRQGLAGPGSSRPKSLDGNDLETPSPGG